MENTAYTKLRLASGREVEIRGRSYAEWEAQEISRLDAAAALPDMPDTADMSPAAQLVLQKIYREVRSARLGLWVKNFDSLKNSLSLRDIAEIEKAADALEAPEVTGGNSGAGGNGP